MNAFQIVVSLSVAAVLSLAQTSTITVPPCALPCIASYPAICPGYTSDPCFCTSQFSLPWLATGCLSINCNGADQTSLNQFYSLCSNSASLGPRTSTTSTPTTSSTPTSSTPISPTPITTSTHHPVSPKTIGGIVVGVVGGLLLVGAVALFFVSRRRPISEPSTATEFPHYTIEDFGRPEKIEPAKKPEQVADEPYAGSHLKFPSPKGA